jgi:hypothetical protein
MRVRRVAACVRDARRVLTTTTTRSNADANSKRIRDAAGDAEWVFPGEDWSRWDRRARAYAVVGGYCKGENSMSRGWLASFAVADVDGRPATGGVEGWRVATRDGAAPGARLSDASVSCWLSH